MSVIVDAAVVPRMWRGWDDPSYPVGAYIANGVLIGDASGGVMQVNFPFKFEAAPADGRFYNIEQISAFAAGPPVASLEAFIRVISFETLGPFVIGERQYHFRITQNLPLSNAGVDFPPMPLFLGQTSRLTAGSIAFSHLQIGTANLNLTAWSVDIQGYIWEPRSVLSEGGLKRPADNLYGQ